MPITVRIDELDQAPLVVRPEELDQQSAPRLPRRLVPYGLQAQDERKEAADEERRLNPRTPDQLQQEVVSTAAREGRTLRDSPDFGLGPVIGGGMRMIYGGKKIATQPGAKAKSRGVSDVIRGGLEAASGIIPLPLTMGTARALATGAAAQYGTEKGLEAVGVDPDYAAPIADVAGIAGGGLVASRGHRSPVEAKVAETVGPKPVGPIEPAPFKSAEESAAVFRAAGTPRPQTARQSAEVFQPPVKPVVPETGIPENVARGQAARETAAQRLGVKWEELSNPDRIAIDDLIAEGKAGSAPGPPKAQRRQVGTAPSARRPLVVRPEEVTPISTPEPPVASKVPAQATREPIVVRPEEVVPVQALEPSTPQPTPVSDILPPYGTELPRGIGEGASVLGSRPARNETRVGRATEVRVPGEDTRYQTEYELRELADIQPSHSGHTFQANPEYQIRNDRNYADPSNQERILINSSPRFDPAFLVNDNPTATNGPPVIDSNGNVYGGNSRVMTLQRVYQGNPEGAAAYRNTLSEKAGQFGFDASHVASMKQPVLVRKLASKSDVSRAVTDMNKRETAELTPAEQSTTDARGMSPRATEYIASALEQSGPDTTISEVLSGNRGHEVVNRLIEEGVFTIQEKPKLVDARTGAVTAHAKERISKMLLGDFFADSDQMQRAEPSLRNKLERIAAPAMTTKGNPEWDLAPKLRESLNLLEYARAHGLKTISDAVRQEDMFGGAPEFSDEAVRLATALRDMTPTALTKAVRQYATEGFDNGTESIFGRSTPKEAFDAAFRNPERGSITINAQAIREKAIDLETQLLDRLAPLRHLVKDKKLTVDSDPYVAARNYAGHYGKIQNRLDQLANILPKGGFWESAIGRRPGLLRDATDYMTLERHVELGSRPDLAATYKIPGGKTVANVQAELAAMEARLGPQKVAEVKRLAQGVRDYSNGILKEAADAGLIGQKAYQSILTKNQKYIPFERLEYLADSVDQMPHGSNSFNVPAQKVIKAISGSEKAIADPVESIIRRTAKTISLIERNKVAEKVASLATDPQFKGIVEPVGKGGFVPAGMDKMAVLRNGVKYEYAVPKNVGKALKGMTTESADLITKWASKSAAALRAGATSLNVAFIPANAVRDFQTATIVSKVGFTPADWIRGFAESVNHGKDFQSYMESGASFSGYFGSQKALPSAARQLTQPLSLKAAKTILNPVELLRYSAEHIEMAPRLGVYKRALRQGLSETEAAFNSRNATVDFAKSGTTLKIVNQWVPFLNARTQGTVNMLGAIKGQPKRAALGLAAIVGAPVVATYLNNTRNHKDVWDDISQYEKDANFLIIYGDAKDEKGNYTQVIKLPKGDAKAFGNPLENFLSYLDKNNPKALDVLATQVLSDLSPVPFERNGKFSGGAVASGTLPPLVKAGVEGITNKNLYTDREIVPTRGPYGDLTKASPENQYTADTPSGFVKAGELTGVSPMKIQNAVATQFGGLGRQISSPSTAGKQISGRFSGAHGGEQETQRFDDLKQVETAVTDENVALARKAQTLYAELSGIPPAERGKRVREMKLDDETLGAIEKIIERQNSDLSRFEAHIRTSPVKTRARFIVQKLTDIPPAERSRIFQDWIDKKIITPSVIEGIEAEIAARP